MFVYMSRTLMQEDVRVLLADICVKLANKRRLWIIRLISHWGKPIPRPHSCTSNTICYVITKYWSPLKKRSLHYFTGPGLFHLEEDTECSSAEMMMMQRVHAMCVYSGLFIRVKNNIIQTHPAPNIIGLLENEPQRCLFFNMWKWNPINSKQLPPPKKIVLYKHHVWPNSSEPNHHHVIISHYHASTWRLSVPHFITNGVLFSQFGISLPSLWTQHCGNNKLENPGAL